MCTSASLTAPKHRAVPLKSFLLLGLLWSLIPFKVNLAVVHLKTIPILYCLPHTDPLPSSVILVWPHSWFSRNFPPSCQIFLFRSYPQEQQHISMWDWILCLSCSEHRASKLEALLIQNFVWIWLSLPWRCIFTAPKFHHSSKKTNTGMLVIAGDKNFFLGAVQFIPAKDWADQGMNHMVHDITEHQTPVVMATGAPWSCF